MRSAIREAHNALAAGVPSMLTGETGENGVNGGKEEPFTPKISARDEFPDEDGRRQKFAVGFVLHAA